MPTRARGKTYWLASPTTGGPLQVVPSPTVNVRNATNTANIADTLYAADDPDPTILAQGFLGNADGLIQFFTVLPQRVVLRVSKTGFTTQDIPLDVNFASNRYLPRGAWSVATTYSFMDVVSYGGASWVAQRTNTGVTPTEGADWTLVASGGVVNTIQDEGVAEAQRGVLNFIGGGVDVTDDSANGRTNVTISSLFVGASVYRSTTQSITNSTDTRIAFDAEDFDTNAFHDSATNSERITIPSGRGGTYRVSLGVHFAVNGTGLRVVRLRKNGTTYLGRYTLHSPTAGDDAAVVLTRTVALAAADYIEVEVWQSSGGALNVNAGPDKTWFEAAFLGA